MASSWFHGKVYSIKFVSGLQSVDDGFSMYSGLLNQENWTSRYNCILLKVRLTTNDT